MSVSNILGVYIGAFNPIHYGHLSSVDIARQVLGIEKTLFVPNYISPTANKKIITDFVHRCNMIELAIAPYDYFYLDKRSSFLTTPSYALDTLISIRKEYDAKLCLLMGNDAMAHFHEWDQYEEILKLAHIAVMCTPHEFIDFSHFDLISSLEHRNLMAAIESYEAGKIFLIEECRGIYASSTFIRSLVAKKLIPHFQTSPEVIDYILKNKLYL